MSLIEEIKKIKQGEKECREFSRVVGIALLLAGGVFVWRGKPWYPGAFLSGLLLLVLGQWKPRALTVLYRCWMTLSLCLGFVMSRILLTVLFYVVVTPVAVITRILGKHFLDTRFRNQQLSYWKPKGDSVRSKEFYERQF